MCWCIFCFPLPCVWEKCDVTQQGEKSFDSGCICYIPNSGLQDVNLKL